MVKFILLIIYFVFLSIHTAAQHVECKDHFYIISDNKEDSMFCIQHYPYYDFENKSINYGVMIPEKLIQGKNISLIDIYEDVKNKILRRFGPFDTNRTILLSILVDKYGKVRGGVTNNEQDSAVLRFAFDNFKTHDYSPAFNRGKPITFCFTFFVKYSNELKIGIK